MITLTALSPIDGRYQDKVNDLRCIFSEFGLLKFRVIVEIRWLQEIRHLYAQKLKKFQLSQAQNYLNHIIEQFNLEDAQRIKEIERITNHDVKAVEYFVRK